MANVAIKLEENPPPYRQHEVNCWALKDAAPMAYQCKTPVLDSTSIVRDISKFSFFDNNKPISSTASAFTQRTARTHGSAAKDSNHFNNQGITPETSEEYRDWRRFCYPFPW